jgi:hypothetical protein
MYQSVLRDLQGLALWGKVEHGWKERTHNEMYDSGR